jgi:hypothetical protein
VNRETGPEETPGRAVFGERGKINQLEADSTRGGVTNEGTVSYPLSVRS